GAVLKTGNSVRDFRAESIVKLPTALTPPPRINLSLPLAVMELMRLGNHSLPSAAREDLRDFLMHCSEWIELAPNDQVEMFGAAHRADLLHRFRPIHAYLNTVAETENFFPDIESVARPRPIPYMDATAQALAQMTPAVLAKLRDETARVFIETLRGRAGFG
ncbi:hypothetical protein, partial [Pseudorhodobacter sp.]|uniref:hypothetical protein n=1 Tax=Pseudorhodobacter sp. TaxID=1934400 RepID=UPI00264A2451